MYRNAARRAGIVRKHVQVGGKWVPSEGEAGASGGEKPADAAGASKAVAAIASQAKALKAVHGATTTPNGDTDWKKVIAGVNAAVQGFEGVAGKVQEVLAGKREVPEDTPSGKKFHQAFDAWARASNAAENEETDEAVKQMGKAYSLLRGALTAK